MSKTILAMLVLVALAGCTKYSVECELVVQPRVMLSSGSDPFTPAYMARVYAFYVDEKDIPRQLWRPESYADADAGLIRNRATSEVRSHGLVGTQGADDYVHIVITKSPVVLVAVDPVNKSYAWRTFKYQVPLERILIPVSFKTYQATPYRENDWTVDKEGDGNPTQEGSE